MKHSSKNLTSFSISATDGEIGKVKDFYFDDDTWTVRYLTVDTGGWLFDRKVLISPHAILHADWENKVFEINLTKEQVRNSPDIDTDKPVSRQHEVLLNQYYPWPAYWNSGLWAGSLGVTGMMAPATLPLEEAINRETRPVNEIQNPHLRSTEAIRGYKVKAANGHIGDIEDFLIDENTMRIDFIIVDTGNWLPGKKVLLLPKWIRSIDWNGSEVVMSASVEQVKNSPEYEANKPISDDYAARLQNYYAGVVASMGYEV